MNILHLLKHDFLIIGFTGPLRSGCTTCAKFFRDEINQEIQKLLEKKSSIQQKIEYQYTKLHDLKNGVQSEQVDNKRDELRRLLKKREVIKVVNDYQDNSFKYISMTDMLIKQVIESMDKYDTLYNKTCKNSKKKKIISNLMPRFKKEFKDIKSLKRLTQLIVERKFSKFKRADLERFENYYQRIIYTRDWMLNWLSDDELYGDLLQDFGDNLRRSGNPFNYDITRDTDPSYAFILAEEANNLIKFFRSIIRAEKTGRERINKFTIEAFRNPYEVEFFRNRYYEFFLVSLFADFEERASREKFSVKRDLRDRGESLTAEEFYKQNVSECVRLSDIAINNQQEDKQVLFEKLIDYFALIKQPGCFAPEWPETAMHMAYSMSVRSTCISRQVGSIIEGSNGYIIGAGWNDVGAGQIGCGYRQIEDFKNIHEDILISNPIGEEDFRRWLTVYGGKDEESICFKDKYSEYIIRKKLKKLEKHRPEEIDKPLTVLKKYLTEGIQRELDIKMMQYCRALHAEENAILQTAIIGGMGVRGGTIYSTTFPCELCAKKIYQSGIRKVVYTEPYPRSISKDVFFQDGTRKIELEHFEGVKSQSYFRLYKATVDKKDFQLLKGLGEKNAITSI